MGLWLSFCLFCLSLELWLLIIPLVSSNLFSHTSIYIYLLSFFPPLFIEVPVTSQESGKSCICVLVVLILSLSTILFIELWDRSDILLWYYFFFIFLTLSFVLLAVSKNDIIMIKKNGNLRWDWYRNLPHYHILSNYPKTHNFNKNPFQQYYIYISQG